LDVVVKPLLMRVQSRINGGKLKMSVRNKIGSLLGLFAGVLSSIFGKSPAKPAPNDFRRTEFKTSTQRLGIRFTERVRDVFRFRWLRKF